MFNLSDDGSLLRVVLAGLLSAVTFMYLYLQEKRRAPDQRTRLRGWGAFLLSVFLMTYAFVGCLGSAVAFDTGNPQFFDPGVHLWTGCRRGAAVAAGKEFPAIAGIAAIFGAYPICTEPTPHPLHSK